jgi:hypothetical protein
MKIFRLMILATLFSNLIKSSMVLKAIGKKVIPESNKLEVGDNRNNDIINFTYHHVDPNSYHHLESPEIEDKIELLSHPHHGHDESEYKTPLLEIKDHEQGLDQFGKMTSKMFRTDPETLYHDDNEEAEKLKIHEMNEEMEEALKDSHMKVPVMLSPIVLKSIIYDLEKVDEFNKGVNEKRRNKNEELKAQAKFISEQEAILKDTEKQIADNQQAIFNVHTEIKAIKNKINDFRDRDDDEEEEEQQIKELEKELDIKEQEENVLEEKKEVEQDIVDLEHTEEDLGGKDIHELEEEKQNLIEEEKELIENEEDQEKVDKIEEEIEKIEQTEEGMNEDNQTEAEEHLEEEKEKLIEEENQLNNKQNLLTIKLFHGRFDINSLSSVSKIVRDYRAIMKKIYSAFPDDVSNYQHAQDEWEKEKEGLLLLTKMKNFARNFSDHKHMLNQAMNFLKDKTFEVKLSTEGIMDFMEQTKAYHEMRLRAPEKNNYEYYQIDKKIREETEGMADEFRLFIDKIKSIVETSEDIDSKIELFKIEEQEADSHINHSHDHEHDEEEHGRILELKFNKRLDEKIQIRKRRNNLLRHLEGNADVDENIEEEHTEHHTEHHNEEEAEIEHVDLIKEYENEKRAHKMEELEKFKILSIQEKIEICVEKVEDFRHDRDKIFEELDNLTVLIHKFKERERKVLKGIDDLEQAIEKNQSELEKEKLSENALMISIFSSLIFVIFY